MLRLKTAPYILSAAAVLTGCQESGPSAPPVAAPPGWADATATFVDVDGADVGQLAIAEGPEGVLLRLSIDGLSPGWHAAHLHQTGDCSDGDGGFLASKVHINPANREHGLLNPAGPKPADLPNIYATPDGRATAEIFRHGVALEPSEAGAAADLHALIDDDGFAVIIHANPDDHLTQPIGGSGGRVACAAVNGALSVLEP